MLAEAEALLAEDDFNQPDAAARCFEVLAWFPDHQEASALVLRAFSDPQLIRDNRKAIGRLIDEWDDRGWQQRRRLALSFRYMCRWEGQYRKYDEAYVDEVIPADVKAILEEGKSQLIQDYLLGQAKGSEAAWHIFQEAFWRTNNSLAAMLWVGELYADQGYFAESVEVLTDLLTQFPQADDARRLWAEVRWWRDNQYKIPWIPPVGSGDGRRFRRMMSQTDPNFAADPEGFMQPMEYRLPDVSKLPDDFEMPPSLPANLVQKFEEILGESSLPLPEERLVDWHYLESLANDEIDTTHFPEWAQYMLLEIDDPQMESYLKQFLLSYLANPSLYNDEEE
jgi:hypothetical protein